jgi:hypothetical protein
MHGAMSGVCDVRHSAFAALPPLPRVFLLVLCLFTTNKAQHDQEEAFAGKAGQSQLCANTDSCLVCVFAPNAAAPSAAFPPLNGFTTACLWSVNSSAICAGINSSDPSWRVFTLMLLGVRAAHASRKAGRLPRLCSTPRIAAAVLCVLGRHCCEEQQQPPWGPMNVMENYNALAVSLYAV